jgi:serine protease Do
VSVTLGRLEDGEKQAKADAAAGDSPDVEPSTLKSLGMSLQVLGDADRKTFKLKDGVNGVLIAGVEPNSPAADRGLKPGDVIEEINQQAVTKPADVAKAIEDLKKQGRKSALLLVGNSAGDVRFVALALN